VPGNVASLATALMKSKMKKLDVPQVREYLQMLMDAGARLYPCKMTCDMFELVQDDFIKGVEKVMTASDFIDLTPGAQISLYKHTINNP
jgi:peroxiredoxin family protein